MRPATGSRHVLHRQVQQALTELSTLAAGLLDAASREASGHIWHASADEIESAFAALAGTAEHDLLDVRPPRWGMPSDRAAAARHRVLVAAPPDRPVPVLSDLGSLEVAGAMIRALDWVPVRLAVADGWTVAAALDDGLGNGYLLVERGSQLARAAAGVAERWWNRAEPIRDQVSRIGPDPWPARSATEATIIAALARGDTDETVARRLGITPRTVRRYVADVSERYGAVSRLQLGVLLGRSGAFPDRSEDTGFTDTAAG